MPPKGVGFPDPLSGTLKCGIAGIIGRLDESNRAALNPMSEAMVHRGPDACGTWVSTPDVRGWGALLAHRRLSILDLSPAGAQPMVDPVTGHVVVLNGEIYNFGDLRRRLVAEGQEFHSTGDTAVMLRALGLRGPRSELAARHVCIRLWNRRERRLLLARDPRGIKPLYLARSSDSDARWSVAFTSEVRALLASGLLGSPHLDSQAVASVVWNGFVVGPGTAVRGVDLRSTPAARRSARRTFGASPTVPLIRPWTRTIWRPFSKRG
jgi:asparagine synthase (glutamine-hydrolysing)